MAGAKSAQDYGADHLIERQMRLRDLREHVGLEGAAPENLPAA